MRKYFAGHGALFNTPGSLYDRLKVGALARVLCSSGWLTGITACGLWGGWSDAAQAEAPRTIQFQVAHFVAQGESPLSADEMARVLAPYDNQTYDLNQLQTVAKALEQAIRDEGYAFYRVIVPPQTLNEQQVILQIVEFHIGAIQVEGNEHFDRANILNSLPGLTENASPNTRHLADQLDAANRHPSKNILLTFRQGDSAGTVDANLDVHDASPLQLSLMANNSGSDETGKMRLTASAQYSNLWQLDHLVTMSYTTSPGHWSDVQQYGGSYSAPIYVAQGWITLFAARSSVDSGIVANDFNVTGSGEVYGLHYLQYLPGLGRYDHQLDVGVDNRLFNNDINFLGQPIGVDVRSAPASLLYRGEYSWSETRLGGHLQWSKNTAMGTKNDDATYALSRFGADSDWDNWHYGLTLDQALPERWQFSLRMTGQYSHSPLISGEQFGLGGAHSVRGYEEREVSVDSGEIYNLELLTPAWEGATGLLFMDYGHGRLQQAQPGENAEDELKGSGIGLRGQWSFVSVSVDVAYAWDETAETDNGDIHVHASLQATY